MARSERERAAPLGGVLAAAAVAGAVAGALIGTADGLLSWSALSQFLGGAGGKLRLLLYLASSYALAGAAAGALATAALWGLARGTRLGDLRRHAAAAHAEARARDPRDAVAGLSLVLAGIPALAGSFGLAYWIAFRDLATRKHPGLVIAVAMAAALAALAAGAVLAFVLGRPVELGLRRLAARPRWARPLSSPWAPPIAAAILVGGAGAAAAIASWETLALLRLRPAWAALAMLAAAGPAYVFAGRAAAARFAALAPGWRRGLVVGVPLALVALVLAAGGAESVRKAAGAYSGLGGPIAAGVRAAGDWDGDGYSRLFGGGDCDDFDAHVHPGAAEIPDNGIDDNCVGGDATTRRALEDVAFAPVPETVPGDFNVVLVTIDTLRADHLGAYGYERDTSPALDRLAADGALFENAWAHAPSTRYSIPAILTGRYPLSVRYRPIPGQWPGLSTANTTIAEILDAAGFYTGAILNYWYFDARRDMDQGFDHYDNENRRLHQPVRGEGPAKTQGTSARQQTDKAIAFVDQHAAERFFLWVHYYDPHYDYETHPGVPDFGPEKIDRYDHEIRFTDQQIGRLLDHLRASGLYEKTVVVVTGDHGEGFGEHGVELHGYHLYAAQTKVPLIVRVPGLSPRRVTMPAGHVDILPTLANLAGAEATNEMQGRSLVDVIGGAAGDAGRWVFQQLSYENNNEMRAAASQSCHVIYNVSPSSSWELYRIDRDPAETTDIIDDPGACAGARAVLEAWYDVSEIPEGAMEALLPGEPSLARATPVDFGDDLRLLAVDLPESVRRGDSFPVTWTWQARGDGPAGWKVFAHFERGGGGRFLGDHEPVRPLSWWREGQFIRYTTTVTVPRNARSGRYRLWTGLFRGAERMPARSEAAAVQADRASAWDVEVTP